MDGRLSLHLKIFLTGLTAKPTITEPWLAFIKKPLAKASIIRFVIKTDFFKGAKSGNVPDMRGGTLPADGAGADTRIVFKLNHGEKRENYNLK